jgi:hypothetical protein
MAVAWNKLDKVHADYDPEPHEEHHAMLLSLLLALKMFPIILCQVQLAATFMCVYQLV